MFSRVVTLMAALLMALLPLSCGKPGAEREYHRLAGEVNRNLELPNSLLIPDSISVDSEHSRFFMADKVIFMGKKDSVDFMLNLNYERALQDNRFNRAERAFWGYLFDGSRWNWLTYTHARLDTNRLDALGSYYFSTFEWNDSHTGGRIGYDRRDTKFDLSFTDLKPLQGHSPDMGERYVFAAGDGTLTIAGNTIGGQVFYQLVQLENVDPIGARGDENNHTNFDLLTLVSQSGTRIISASDSLTPNEKLYKNFISCAKGDSILFADGAANVRIGSDLIRRDFKITDPLALQKLLDVPSLGIKLDLALTDDRLFFATGFAIAIVSGTVEIDGVSEPIWGMLEHWQQPKSDGAALK